MMTGFRMNDIQRKDEKQSGFGQKRGKNRMRMSDRRMITVFKYF